MYLDNIIERDLYLYIYLKFVLPKSNAKNLPDSVPLNSCVTYVVSIWTLD